MQKANDPYIVLGVARTAANEEIRKAYRQKTLRCHPDRFPGDKSKEDEFLALKDAYDQIDTPEKRRKLSQASGVSLRQGAAGAHTGFYRKLFRLEEGGRQ